MVNRSTDWHAPLKESVMADPEARAEYEAFELRLDLADKIEPGDQEISNF